MTILIVTFTPKPGKLEELTSAFASVVPRVHEEPGCELYAVNRCGDRLVLIEKWADESSLEVHRNAPALAEFRKRTADLMGTPMDVLFLDAVPMGSSAKGAV
jgi:quinol monooxygenase YgiN